MMPSVSHDEFGELSNLVVAACTDSTSASQASGPKGASGFMVTAGERVPTSTDTSSSLYSNAELRMHDDRGKHNQRWQHQSAGHGPQYNPYAGANSIASPPTSSNSSSLKATAAPFRVREASAAAGSASGSMQSSMGSLFSVPPGLPMMGGPAMAFGAHANGVSSTWPPVSSGGTFRGGGPAVSPPPPPPALPMEWVQQFLASHPHLVTVQNLEPRTTKKQLWHIFYPMGATDAAVLAPTMHTLGGGGSGRRSVGVVMFSSAEMAKIAAEKLNDFVPHGQSFPLVVTFVGASSASSGCEGQPASAMSSVNSSGEVTTTSQCGSSSSAPPVSDGIDSSRDVQKLLANTEGSNSNVELLSLLASVVSRQGAAAEDIALVMITMMRRPQSTLTLVEDAVRIVRDQIVAMGAHSAIFTPPLVGALQKVVDRMERSSTSSNCNLDFPQHALDLYAGFKRFFSQAMLQLLLNPTADKGCRCVAGVAIGHLFDLGFLAGRSPFAMARKLISSNDGAISAARRCMDASYGTADHHGVHAPWINLVESLIAMTSSWASRHPTRDFTDDDEMHFQAFVKQFYGHDDDDQGSPAFSHGSGTPRHEEAHQAKQTPPPTPSSRPTPTSAIVSRVSPAKSSQSSTPRGHHVGQVQNSPRSECGATPLDMSVESNAGCASVQPSLGVCGPMTTASFSTTAPGLWQPTQRIAPPQRGSGQQPASVSGGGSGAHQQVTYETTLQKDLLACTVYLTKLPGGLTDPKVRRLIQQFGEFNKVRMYKEKTPPAIRGSSTLSSLSSSSHQARGCFGFVEYAHASSAKAIIDYFRNASMTSTTPFHFLSGSDPTTQFSADDIALLAQTRASYAKSAIHDQHPKDAVFEPAAAAGVSSGGGQAAANIKVQPCTFGMMSQPFEQQPNASAPCANPSASLPARLPLPSPVHQPQHHARGATMVFTDNAHFPRGRLEHSSSCSSSANDSGVKATSGRSLYIDPSTHQRDGGGSPSEPAAALRLGFFDSSDTTW